MRGRASWRSFAQEVLTAFPDMKVMIDEILAEENVVAVRWHSVATQDGPFLGLRATGKVIPMTNFDIFYVKDGQITGAVSHPDAATALEALGIQQGTPAVRSLRFADFNRA